MCTLNWFSAKTSPSATAAPLMSTQYLYKTIHCPVFHPGGFILLPSFSTRQILSAQWFSFTFSLTNKPCSDNQINQKKIHLQKTPSAPIPAQMGFSEQGSGPWGLAKSIAHWVTRISSLKLTKSPNLSILHVNWHRSTQLNLDFSLCSVWLCHIKSYSLLEGHHQHAAEWFCRWQHEARQLYSTRVRTTIWSPTQYFLWKRKVYGRVPLRLA